MLVIGGLALAVTGVAIWVDLFDLLYAYSRSHEHLEVDEILTFGFVASIAMAVFAWRRVTDQRREIRARRAAEKRAHILAHVDDLTGLANRRRLEPELAMALKSARMDRKRAFMLLDMNRFKPINDVYGHQAGDVVLAELADRLSNAVNSDSQVFRLGGDEFAVLTGPMADTEQIGRAARRIVSALDRPFVVDGSALSAGVAVGIAVAPDDATTPSELMRRADIALYRAKNRKVTAYNFFEAGMDRAVLRRSRLEADMRTAINDGSIYSCFQPIVRMKDRQIVGFEALARWAHPTYGEIPAPELFAVAEECGMLPRLSESLLRQTCRAAADWPARLFVSINASPSEINDQALVLRIMKALADTGLPAHRLEIEISERTLVEGDGTAIRVLRALREVGVGLALDDVGAGSSSLRYLHDLSFGRLKIDRSFIGDMATSSEVASIVHGVIRVATTLGLKTTAEGVEDAAQIDPLIAEGCSEAQGYHFGGPLPAAAVADLIGGPKLRDTG